MYMNRVPNFSPCLKVHGDISMVVVTLLIFVEANINTEKYCQILQEGLLEPAIGQSNIPFWLQQENALSHTSAFIEHWFNNNHITLWIFLPFHLKMLSAHECQC